MPLKIYFLKKCVLVSIVGKGTTLYAIIINELANNLTRNK